MMKKILIILITLLLCGCTNNQKQENTDSNIEPDSFEPSSSTSKQTPFYVYPIADKDGNMVIPLDTDVCIITTDESKAEFMDKTFEETILFYHMILDPTHEFESINNIKTINDNYGKGPVKVDPALIEVIKSAIDLAEQTAGYFNPTVGQAANVWKNLFNEEHKNNDPSSEEVNKALACSIPYEKLRDYIVIDEANCTVTFNKLEDAEDNIIIDLGAYSKGYVLDRAYEKLLKYKAGFLISAGGSSIITYVEPTQEKLHWTVAVRNPNTGSSAFDLRLTNGFISTSGDDQQFFINEDGIRRTHIINPFTGYSENYYRSITLVANSDAGLLDGLSTAIFNLPPEQTPEIVKNIEEANNVSILKALITESSKGNLTLTYDEAFNDVMQDIDTFQIKNIVITK